MKRNQDIQLLLKKSFRDFFVYGKQPVKNMRDSESQIFDCRIPDELFLPVVAERGQKRQLMCQKGERIRKGDLLAIDELGHLPLHAPTSGHFVSLEPQISLDISGREYPTIVLRPDGLDEWGERLPFDFAESFRDPQTTFPYKIKELHDFLRNKGIIGMGGAGYPSVNKMALSYDKNIHTLLVNLCECEPIISCDLQLSTYHAEALLLGVEVVRNATGSERAVIVVEDGMVESIEQINRFISEYPKVSIKVTDNIYPSGHEKQLVYLLSGKNLKPDQRPADLGYVVFNAATCFACYRAVAFGDPLVQRIVTVSDGVKTINQWVMLGTKFSDLLQWHDMPIDLSQKRLVIGGPMNGKQVFSTEVGVSKTTNCVLILDPEIKTDGYSSCIRCGDCVEVCPVDLMPQQLYWFARSDQPEKSEQHRLFDCIECGNCAYVCPSHIPLVQFYRRQKQEIFQKREVQNRVVLAKQRHDKRTLRLQREREEFEIQLSKRKEEAKKRLLEHQSKQQAEGTQESESVKQAVMAARNRAMKMKRAP